MGNNLTKCCCIGRSTNHSNQFELQREKLEEHFHYITSKAAVDYTNQEIKDIQNAVLIMLEKIRTRVNNRGIFDIDRIVPSGSAAEQTSLWKFGDENHYLEFDFLSVLKNKIRQCEDQPSQQHCQGCIEIVNPPVELKRLRQYYNKEDEFSGENLKDKSKISDLFLYEINYCLTSSCDCLSFQCYKDEYGNYKISFRTSSVEHNHGCCECTIDMPTGTLYVNTEIKIDQKSFGPNNCSLIFQWTSKSKTLSAPDELLLPKPQPIPSLPIYIDFLPALESLKPTSPGLEDEHDYFIVPKHCNVCYDEKPFRSFRDRWRKSWCMAEIQAITHEMSDKHRRCYQIMKYLIEVRVLNTFPNYAIKTVVLRHHATCSDTTDDCVDCVIGMFQYLGHACRTCKLLSYQSNLNILNDDNHDDYIKYHAPNCERNIYNLFLVSDTDSWGTFIRKFQYR